jgi:hypothetical protein
LKAGGDVSRWRAVSGILSIIAFPDITCGLNRSGAFRDFKYAIAV